MEHSKFFDTLSIHSMTNNFKLNKHEWEKEKKLVNFYIFPHRAHRFFWVRIEYIQYSVLPTMLSSIYFFFFFFIEFMLISFVSILYFVSHISWIARRRQNRKRNVQNGAPLRRYRRMPNSRRPKRNEIENENHFNWNETLNTWYLCVIFIYTIHIYFALFSFTNNINTNYYYHYYYTKWINELSSDERNNCGFHALISSNRISLSIIEVTWLNWILFWCILYYLSSIFVHVHVN